MNRGFEGSFAPTSGRKSALARQRNECPTRSEPPKGRAEGGESPLPHHIKSPRYLLGDFFMNRGFSAKGGCVLRRRREFRAQLAIIYSGCLVRWDLRGYRAFRLRRWCCRDRRCF